MASRGVNKVILVGNVGQDPETRYMPNGGAVTNLSIATSEAWKNSGEQQERTEWHRCVFYNRLAEVVAEYVRKGSKLYIEGKLQTRSWEQDGVKRYATEIIASEMQMLDGRSGGDSDQRDERPRSNGGSPRQQQHRAPTSESVPPNNFYDDDIPF